jgi:hypothetical protein
LRSRQPQVDGGGLEARGVRRSRRGLKRPVAEPTSNPRFNPALRPDGFDEGLQFRRLRRARRCVARQHSRGCRRHAKQARGAGDRAQTTPPRASGT